MTSSVAIETKKNYLSVAVKFTNNVDATVYYDDLGDVHDLQPKNPRIYLQIGGVLLDGLTPKQAKAIRKALKEALDDLY